MTGTRNWPIALAMEKINGLDQLFKWGDVGKAVKRDRRIGNLLMITV